ncbi:MAG TPA: PLD nuclease N-terminal domain-containing protein [Prolixibacteraceae bacterium]|nr:PLD nuclease N-terminal domain-containing protein [Prolixibacteraceae bacterium]
MTEVKNIYMICELFLFLLIPVGEIIYYEKILVLQISKSEIIIRFTYGELLLKKHTHMELLGIIGPQELIIILFFGFGILLLPLLAIVDILRSRFEGNLQLIWVIVVVFFNIIGSILYFIIGRNQKIQR